MLALFAAVLVLVGAGGYGVGALVGPVAPPGAPSEHTTAEHTPVENAPGEHLGDAEQHP